MTETELIARTLAGDMRAQTALIRTHYRMLYRTARGILRDDAEAEDAVQEAYLQAFRALGTFRGESKLSTWLVRITANEALMRWRRNAKAAPRTEAELDDLASDEAGPEGTAQGGEMRQLLEAHIGALPEGYRKVFMLQQPVDKDVALGEVQSDRRTLHSSMTSPAGPYSRRYAQVPTLRRPTALRNSPRKGAAIARALAAPSSNRCSICAGSAMSDS